MVTGPLEEPEEPATQAGSASHGHGGLSLVPRPDRRSGESPGTQARAPAQAVAEPRLTGLGVRAGLAQALPPAVIGLHFGARKNKFQQKKSSPQTLSSTKGWSECELIFISSIIKRVCRIVSTLYGIPTF